MKAFRPTKSRVIFAYIVNGDCNTDDLKADTGVFLLKPDSYLLILDEDKKWNQYQYPCAN